MPRVRFPRALFVSLVMPTSLAPSSRARRWTGQWKRLPGDPLRDALPVQQRGQPAVPEREAGAGDHRQVEVLGRGDDALVEHPARLVGQRCSTRGRAPARPGPARPSAGTLEDRRDLRVHARSPASVEAGLAGGDELPQVRRDVEPVREGPMQRLAVVQRDGRADQRRAARTAASGRPRRTRRRRPRSACPRRRSGRPRPEAAEQAVDDERRAVLDQDAVFFSALPVANAVASVASSVALAADDLEQRHHRDRVEEVEAHDPLGVREVRRPSR